MHSPTAILPPIPALPSKQQFELFVSHSPAPIRPYARTAFVWLHRKLHPLEYFETEDGETLAGEDPDDYEEFQGVVINREGAKQTMFAPEAGPCGEFELVPESDLEGYDTDVTWTKGQGRRVEGKGREVQMETMFVPVTSEDESKDTRRRRLPGERHHQLASRTKAGCHNQFPQNRNKNQTSPSHTKSDPHSFDLHQSSTSSLRTRNKSHNLNTQQGSNEMSSKPPNKIKLQWPTFPDPPERKRPFPNLEDHPTRKNPTPKSDTSSPVLAGSEFIVPARVRLPLSQRFRVHGALNQAMYNDEHHFRVWPTFEGEESFVDLGARSDGMKIDKGKAREEQAVEGGQEEMGRDRSRSPRLVPLDVSELYQLEVTRSETACRARIAAEWENKAERDIKDRRRIEGGLEDVVEGERLKDVGMFGPTLDPAGAGVGVQPYQVQLGGSSRVIRPGDQRGENVKGGEEKVMRDKSGRRLGMGPRAADSDGTDEHDSSDEELRLKLRSRNYRATSRIVTTRYKKERRNAEEGEDSEASLQPNSSLRKSTQKTTKAVEKVVSVADVVKDQREPSPQRESRFEIERRIQYQQQKRESSEETENRFALGLEDIMK